MAPLKTKLPRIPKCAPGTMCVDYWTAILLILIFAFILYLVHRYYAAELRVNRPTTTATLVASVSEPVLTYPRPDINLLGLPATIGGISTRLDVLNDPYLPPVKLDGYVWEKSSGDVRGLPPILSPVEVPVLPPRINRVGYGGYLPVNVETRGLRSDYTQIGILTQVSGNDKKRARKMFSDELDIELGNTSALILPLMGRRSLTGRDKWQYYTISNTGVVNTKLPIKVRGKRCSSEYGCDEIMEGDTVYVDGYNHEFRATIYDNGTFSYIPVI